MDTQHYKLKLTTRRDELFANIGKIEDQLDNPKSPDVEERSVEREDDEVLELQAKAEAGEIAAIELALRRIENGVFGICVDCHEQISVERLEAVPHAAKCRNCMD